MGFDWHLTDSYTFVRIFLLFLTLKGYKYFGFTTQFDTGTTVILVMTAKHQNENENSSV